MVRERTGAQAETTAGTGIPDHPAETRPNRRVVFLDPDRVLHDRHRKALQEGGFHVTGSVDSVDDVVDGSERGDFDVCILSGEVAAELSNESHVRLRQAKAAIILIVDRDDVLYPDLPNCSIIRRPVSGGRLLSALSFAGTAPLTALRTVMMPPFKRSGRRDGSLTRLCYERSGRSAGATQCACG